jgi:cell division protein FtsI/penicillin-binding protein 2
LLSALCALALTASISGCGLFESQPGPPEVTNDFLARLASGDTQGAAELTDDAASARKLLDEVRTGLNAQGITTAVDQVRDASGDAATADATATLTWDLGEGRSWSYQTTLDLRREGDAWRVHWAPTVVHPKLSEQQTIARSAITPQPAPVLDRDGSPLLSPEQVVSIVLNRAAAGDLAAVAKTLAEALHPLDDEITEQSITEGAQAVPEGQLYQVAALRDADYQSVKPKIYELPGVSFTGQTNLLPPTRGFGSQVLPAVRTFVEKDLAGESGFRVTTLNVAGAEVEELYAEQPKPAEAVSTGLSRAVQTAAEDALEPVEEAAMLVALQPSTGDVLAVAQNAAADEQGPIALSGQFPPGSTFKIITAASAMENGRVTADAPVGCPGKTTIDGRRIVPNDREFDKGTIPLHSAFAFSCNTTFSELAAALPADALTSTSAKLGLGADFDVPGITTITGSVPPADDVVERAEDGIGQGKVLASPFGMALVAASVARGTVPTPALLRGRETTSASGEPAAITPEVLDPVRAMMREVVETGTAVSLKDLGDVRGKTGTAQFGDGVNSHGWFVGYRGDLAFATLVLGGNTSAPAVEATGRFLRAAG